MTRYLTSSQIAPASLVLVALVVGSVGLTDPAYLDFQGDAARYLMNGVFLHDLARDAPIALRDPRAYAEQYYARYPALSLGHHPALPSLLMVPVFGVFGLSVAGARVVPLVSFIVAALFLFVLVDRIYDRLAATAAMLLFIVSPFAARFSRTFTGEMPALAAMMAAVYFCDRFGRLNERRDAWLCAASAIVSVTGKLLTACMFPVCCLHYVGYRGLRWLRNPRVLAATILASIAIAAVARLTLAFTLYDVAWISRAAVRPLGWVDVAAIPAAMTAQVSRPVVGLAAIGAVLAVLRRERRSMLFSMWVMVFAVVVILLTRRFVAERFTVYWVPALCTLAATTLIGWTAGSARVFAMTVFALSVGFEAFAAARVHLEGAGGYQEAALFVVQETHTESTVLFSGDLDTGYFAFFVRQQDSARRLVVVRSDKLLTTSLGAKVAIRDKIQRAEEIDPILSDLGTRFVVIEDAPSASQVLNWLRVRVKQPPFVERLRVPLRSTVRSAEALDIVVFENIGVPAPNLDATLDFDLPIVHQAFQVRLADVMFGPGRRE